jgi:Skp family chaperone for outer membrane proteins
MKKTSLVLAAIAATMLVVTAVHAEEAESVEVENETTVEVSVTPPLKELRKEFREERKEMRKENVENRKELRKTIQDERKEMQEENKNERETFREEWKNATPEQRLSLMPTRKAMVKENIQQRRTFWESAKTRWTDLGTTIRAGWKDLFTKWFGAK